MSLSALTKKNTEEKNRIDKIENIHKLSTRELRGNLSEVLEAISGNNGIAVVTSHGKPKVAMISMTDLFKLMEDNDCP